MRLLFYEAPLQQTTSQTATNRQCAITDEDVVFRPKPASFAVQLQYLLEEQRALLLRQCQNPGLLRLIMGLW